MAQEQACLDLIYASDDPGKDHFIRRVESRKGVRTIEAADRKSAMSIIRGEPEQVHVLQWKVEPQEIRAGQQSGLYECIHGFI